MPWTYMLECSDGSFYVGSTRNLDARLADHANGLGAEYTRRRRPVRLIWAAEFSNIGEAFGWEKRIQGWSRAKRIALVTGEFEKLPALSMNLRKRRKLSRDGPDTA